MAYADEPPTPQPHILYHPEGVDDIDWVKFCAVPTAQGHTYTAEAGNLEGTYPVIEIYKEADLTKTMPAWITGELGDSIGISVKTGREVVAEALDCRSLPFMMGEESR